MSPTWKDGFKRVLEKGEMAGLILMTLLLIVMEVGLVYWLNHLRLPGQPLHGSEFLAVPPWPQNARFEITLVLTLAAGSIFRVCGMLRGAWPCRNHASSAEFLKAVRQRIKTAASVTVIAAVNLALATWLR